MLSSKVRVRPSVTSLSVVSSTSTVPLSTPLPSEEVSFTSGLMAVTVVGASSEPVVLRVVSTLPLRVRASCAPSPARSCFTTVVRVVPSAFTAVDELPLS